MRQRILVTGGAGYVGSHTTLALLNDREVAVLDNLCRGHRQLVPAQAHLRVADLRDRKAVFDVVSSSSFDAVVHFAALAYVGESMTAPGPYFETNVGGTQNLLDAMVAARVGRLVFSSSCAVYGAPQTLPLTETHVLSPVNPYGESKAAVERMLQWYDRVHGLRSVSLRYFNAGGADRGGRAGELHDPEPHLIPQLLRAALGGPPLSIYGDNYDTPDGTAIRDYVHVSDLAAAHVAALDYLASGGPSLALNLGTGQGVSVRQMAACASAVLGRSIPTRTVPRRPGDPPALVADARLAGKVLGWVPQFSVSDQIASAWAWMQAQPEQGRKLTAHA